jgi:cobalt-zinc-cadmium efflux system protein
MERITDQGATLKRALALTCVILAVEFAGGVVSHSLALLSDAGHVLTDVFALGLAWFAIEQAKRPADRRRSYGYQRVSILAALVNSVTLMVIVVAGAIILLTGWLYIDPILSLAIAALIAYGAWRIVRETVNLLLEGTPREVNLAEVTTEIANTEHVISAHDLHVWALSSEEMALSVHIVLEECPLGDAEHVVRDLEGRLCSRFDIGHTTIQVESCHPCGEIHHGAGEHNHPHEHVLMTTSSVPSPSAGPAVPPRAAESA